MTDPFPVNDSTADSPADPQHDSAVVSVGINDHPIVGDSADTHPTPLIVSDAVNHDTGESQNVVDTSGTDEASTFEEERKDVSELAQLISPISANLDEINRRLEIIESTAEIRLKRDTHQQSIIDRLHAELQIHKDGFVLKLLQPLAIDLISVVDDIGKIIDRNQPGAVAGQSAEKLVESFAVLRDELEIILERYGFVADSSEHEIFDPHSQRAVRRIATRDTTLDRKIERRLGRSLSYEGRQIRPELVAVYRAETPAEPAEIPPAL